jgi:hypothetical protein
MSHPPPPPLPTAELWTLTVSPFGVEAQSVRATFANHGGHTIYRHRDPDGPEVATYGTTLDQVERRGSPDAPRLRVQTVDPVVAVRRLRERLALERRLLDALEGELELLAAAVGDGSPEPECRACPHRRELAVGASYCGHAPDEPGDPENSGAAEAIHDLVETGADPAGLRLPETGTLPRCPRRRD